MNPVENRAEAPKSGRDLQLCRQRDFLGYPVGWFYHDHAARRVSTMYPTRQAALDAWTNRTITWKD